MTPASRSRGTSARRELLYSIAALFVGAVLVAVVAVAIAFPLLESPSSALLFLTVILGADLIILFLFLRSLLARTLFTPLERIGASAERIAEGDLEHRIPEAGAEELDRLIRSLNGMAEHLIANQARLSENVASLDRANRDLREATDGLVRSARLASVGTMAAGIAHEIGNPLGAVMGYLDVARNRQPEDSPAREPLEAAVQEARRIDRIIRSVLEFARPDRSGGRAVVLDLGGVVREVTGLLRGRGALEGVDLELNGLEDLYQVRLPSQHMEQVFMNLCMNALSATEGQARRLLRLTADGSRPGAVVLLVEDNGPGIPAELLPRIFDPFFTTREPGRGTGLGLSLAVRILEEAGGRIEAENREEGGARFRLELPVAAGAPEPHPREREPDEGGDG